MYCNLSGRSFIAACFFIALSTAAQAAELVAARFGKGDVAISGSVDYLNLLGDEQVYYGPKDSRLLSRLFWDTSSAAGLTGNVRYGFTDQLSVYGSATIGFLANSYMTDYDWRARDTFGIDDWTDRSQHPDTALDHYYALDIGARFTVLQNSDRDFGVIGGVRYTDVKWSARGGDYVYSGCTSFPDDCYFREDIGNFPDGQPGITYQQKLPAYYTGIAGSIDQGLWTFDGALKIGATVGARDIDHHWQRDILFLGDFKPGLYLGVSANANYRVKENVRLSFGFSYDHYGLVKGSVTTYSIATGEFSGFEPANSGGAALRALRLSAGLNAKF